MAETLVLNPVDNVAILTELTVSGEDPLGTGVPMTSSVPSGHKVARVSMESGDAIRKFGQIIGYATESIPAAGPEDARGMFAPRRIFPSLVCHPDMIFFLLFL